MPLRVAQCARELRKLHTDRDGAIMIEFAYVLPIFMLLGFTGIELAHLAIANMRVNQIAMTVADNVSRAKQSVQLELPQLREVDINDALLGARIQGGDSLDILGQGRIIVSSLQRDADGRQTITWQRCKGVRQANSSYGAQGVTEPSSGSGGFQGMGVGSARVRAEPNSAIIFAEVVYTYKPLFAEWAFGTPTIRREAAFYVRDDRDLSRVYNPAPHSTPANCGVYNDTF